MEEKSIGYEIKTIDNLILRHIIAGAKKNGAEIISPYQMMIFKFLIKNSQNRKIYQKDLEQEFLLRRSSISGILATMERNGMIKRVDSQVDARSKEILLTDFAYEMAKKHKSNSKIFDKILQTNISENDLKTFFKVTKQIRKNLGGGN